MRRQWRIFLTIFVAFAVLTACRPKYEVSYQLEPPATAEGQRCLTQCKHSEQHCAKLCTQRSLVCQRRAKAIASSAYQQYLEQQRQQSLPAEKSPEDFFDTSRCQTDCQCKQDYNACFELCGGHRVAKKHCVAHCNKDT